MSQVQEEVDRRKGKLGISHFAQVLIENASPICVQKCRDSWEFRQAED